MTMTHGHDKTGDIDVADDVMEVLEAQHAEIRRLIRAVNAGPGGDQRDDFAALIRLLAVHETAEAEVVFPAVAVLGDDARSAVEGCASHHGDSARILTDLEKIGVGSPAFAGRFAGFGRSVDAHASLEEATIFELLRSEVGPDARRSMATLLSVAQATAPTNAHRHAPVSTLDHPAGGPFVRITDRVRDAIHAARR